MYPCKALSFKRSLCILHDLALHHGPFPCTNFPQTFFYPLIPYPLRTPIPEVQRAGPLTACSLARNGQWLAGSYTMTQGTGCVFVWDLQQAPDAAAVKCQRHCSDCVRAVAINDDGSVVVSASSNEIIVWDLLTRTVRHVFHVAAVCRLCITADGACLASLSAAPRSGAPSSPSVRIWNLTLGAQQVELPGKAATRNIMLSVGTRNWLATLAWEAIYLWTAQGEPVGSLDSGGEKHGPYQQAAVSHSGRLLAASHADGICLWDLKHGLSVRPRVLHVQLAFNGHALALSSDDHWLVVVDAVRAITLWHAKSGVCMWRVSARIDLSTACRPRPLPMACFFGPNCFATRAMDDIVQVWRPQWRAQTLCLAYCLDYCWGVEHCDAIKQRILAFVQALPHSAFSMYHVLSPIPCLPAAMVSPTCSEPGDINKLFVGGLNWDTTAAGLRSYLSAFGEVASCNIIADPVTQRSR